MNYIKWANDYLKTANRFNDRIISLKERKKHTNNFIDKLNIRNLQREESVGLGVKKLRMKTKQKEVI